MRTTNLTEYGNPPPSALGKATGYINPTSHNLYYKPHMKEFNVRK